MLVYPNATVFVLKYFFRYFHPIYYFNNNKLFSYPQNELNAHNFVKYQEYFDNFCYN